MIWLLPSLALAACGTEAPPPYEQQQSETAATVDASRVVLRGNGLAAGAESFFFSAGRSEVERSLTAALGEPEGRQQNDECGAGAMEFTAFPGGLTVNFQNDFLVGWYVDEASTNIVLEGGGGVATPRTEIAETPGFTMIADSTLGEEFALGDSIGGFLDENGVSGLYAGTNCFFR